MSRLSRFPITTFNIRLQSKNIIVNTPFRFIPYLFRNSFASLDFQPLFSDHPLNLGEQIFRSDPVSNYQLKMLFGLKVKSVIVVVLILILILQQMQLYWFGSSFVQWSIILFQFNVMLLDIVLINGGFPNDIRPLNIKLKRVSANINSNRVSVNIKMERVSENINWNQVSVNIKLKRVPENMRKY